MNKADLAQDIADRQGVDRKQAAASLEAVLEAITVNVARGEKLTLSGFGTFERVEREARTARNPATGASIEVPATRVVKFKPATALKTAVAGD